MSLAGLRAKWRTRRFPEDLLKTTLLHIFYALDFLHTEAKLVHADRQEKNIKLAIEDFAILSAFKTDKLENPSPHGIDGDRIIYQSRELRIPKTRGRPVLCDFEEARMGSALYHEDIQPYLYRAPEIWDLFENKHLFDARDEKKQDSNLHHLAEMVALLGPPPKDFLKRSDYAPEFFDDQGDWKGATAIPDILLAGLEENLSCSNMEMFLQFMRKTLQWAPEARQSARTLLDDPWLRSS